MSTCRFHVFWTIKLYKITKMVRAFWLVKNLCFIVPENKLFCKSNRPQMGLRAWDVGRTLEKLVKHSPSDRDLQAFLLYLPTSRVGYRVGKPIKSGVYCLNMPYNLIFLIIELCFSVNTIAFLYYMWQLTTMWQHIKKSNQNSPRNTSRLIFLCKMPQQLYLPKVIVFS